MATQHGGYDQKYGDRGMHLLLTVELFFGPERRVSTGCSRLYRLAAITGRRKPCPSKAFGL